jgi:hypothetical protein
LQDFINQVPDILQPVIIALVAAVPYLEGEGASVFGIIAGINPVVAALAAIAGNFLCVVGVVLLGSRIRGRLVARRAAGPAKSEAAPVAVSTQAGQAVAASTSATPTSTDADRGSGTAVGDGGGDTDTNRGAKGRNKLRRWLVRFGVPGASLLAPLALPTMLTAAFFVASGVRKEWVLLWQLIAIVLWTGAAAAAATCLLALLGW